MRQLMYVMMATLAIASPLYADIVIFQEDFEGGTPGTALNTLGWSGDGNIVISSSVLDSGQSADYPGSAPAWPVVTKGISHAPGAGEIYTLTATLYSPNTSGAYADVRIRNSSDPDAQMQGVAIGYGDMQFGVINATTVRVTPQPTGATDVKLVMQDDSSEFYYKAHGDSSWTYAGEMTSLGWSLSAYDEIVISGHGGAAGGIDSILLTSNVPEPSSICMAVASLFGLLAYAWRKRR